MKLGTEIFDGFEITNCGVLGADMVGDFMAKQINSFKMFGYKMVNNEKEVGAMDIYCYMDEEV